MTNDELQALVAQNSQDIAGLKQLLGSIITDVIQPLGERSVEIERLIERHSEQIEQNAQRSLENEKLFRTLLAEAREDRMNNQRRFEEMLKRLDEQRDYPDADANA